MCMLQILDDLELEFQIQRVRVALDEYCGREWCALQFARWFEDVNCDHLLKEAGGATLEDLPPIFQHDYAEQRALAALRCFEQRGLQVLHLSSFVEWASSCPG